MKDIKQNYYYKSFISFPVHKLVTLLSIIVDVMGTDNVTFTSLYGNFADNTNYRKWCITVFKRTSCAKTECESTLNCQREILSGDDLLGNAPEEKLLLTCMHQSTQNSAKQK